MPSFMGKGIAITRPAGQAGKLSALISAAGGVPMLFPLIEIVPLERYSQFEQVISELVSGSVPASTIANLPAAEAQVIYTPKAKPLSACPYELAIKHQILGIPKEIEPQFEVSDNCA